MIHYFLLPSIEYPCSMKTLGCFDLVPLLLVLAILPLAAQATKPVVIGYYPSWNSALPINQIRLDQFTHLIHAFVTIHKGALRTAGNLPSRELTQAAHAAGVKVLLGFGGADSGGELAAMTRNPATEKTVVLGLAKLVADNSYDGVDVDWEFPTAADEAGVVDFVAQLRHELQQTNPAALITMPVPSAAHDAQYFDGPHLAPLLDLALIMAYDAHGPWKAGKDIYCHAGFDAPLYDTSTDPVDGGTFSYQQAVDYWRAKGFTNRQLVVGIHFSGHGFMVEKWGDTPV
jgi:chitinase